MCAESDDDVSPSQPRGDEAELQGIRHPQVPQSPGKTSVKPLEDLHNLPFIVDISVYTFFSVRLNFSGPKLSIRPCCTMLDHRK